MPEPRRRRAFAPDRGTVPLHCVRPELSPDRPMTPTKRLLALLLAGLAHLGEEQVAVVAVALFGVEHRRCDPGAALVLPLAEAAGHRDDVRLLPN